MKKTYKVSKWRTAEGRDPIGIEYRNRWLYATLKGDNLTDCTIDKVIVHIPKMRCTFEPAGEFRMKYGGVTVKHAMGSSNNEVVSRSYKMNGVKDKMFKDGTGEVVFYAYHPYDEGYLAIDDPNVTVEVEYTPKASKLEVVQTTVMAGGSLAYKIVPYNSAYSHKITLTMGDKSASHVLAAGELEGSIDVPLDWLTLIPNSRVYEGGTLKLETYKGDALLGSKTLNNITMTSPIFGLYVEYECEVLHTVDGVTYPIVEDNGEDVMVQGKCGLRVKVPKADGAYGASVTVTIRIGDKTVTGPAPLTLDSDLLRDTSVTVHVSCIDTRGFTSINQPEVIALEPYSPPEVEFDAWRVDDDGNPNAFGTKGWYELRYKAKKVSDEYPVTVTLEIGDARRASPPESGFILPGMVKELDPEKAYDVTARVRSLDDIVTRTVRIPSAAFLLHGRGDGLGAGIGHVGDKVNALVINPEWGIWSGDLEIVSALRAVMQDVEALKAQN